MSDETRRYEGAILWDLDGTLLTTARAGRIALAAAVRELTGREADYAGLATSGLTDAAVHASALRAAGVEPESALVARVGESYVRRLPEALLLREGGALPGIVETLEGLAARGRVASLLLTGNIHGGAVAKLRRYDLERHFPHGGAFCEADVDRGPIARRALQLALELTSRGPDAVVVVGDTPHDVACATEVGLRAIGLATGAHSTRELRDAGAWRVFERVPAAAALERLVLAGED